MTKKNSKYWITPIEFDNKSFVIISNQSTEYNAVSYHARQIALNEHLQTIVSRSNKFLKGVIDNLPSEQNIAHSIEHIANGLKCAGFGTRRLLLDDLNEFDSNTLIIKTNTDLHTVNLSRFKYIVTLGGGASTSNTFLIALTALGLYNA